MSNKKFVMITVSLIVVFIFLIGTLNVLIDPLFLYHKPWLGLDPVVIDERYQVAGMAKNFEYDNCILGNSLCENFKASTFDEYFEGSTLKLAISGSVAKDWTYVLEILENRVDLPSKIFSNIDPFTLSYAYDKLNTDLPAFIYDDNYFNDCNYLLNFDICAKYTLNTLLANITGNEPDLDTAFLKSNASKEIVLNSYTRSEIAKTEPDKSEILYTVQRNIDLLTQYIKSMNTTEFYFFFTPFSILYWDNVTREKKDDWWYETYNLVCEELLEYPNVKIYLWTDNEMFSMMSDLDNYIDAAHYGPLMCDELVKRMGVNQGLLTKNNYRKEIDKLFNYTQNYDYDSIWSK